MVAIREHVDRVRRWLLWAVIPALLLGILSYLYVRREPGVYQASATLLVQQSANSSTGAYPGTDIAGSTQLAQTYTQIITDPVIVAAADRELQRRYPGYRLESHGLTAQQPKPGQVTQVVGISVSDTVPARAAVAANAVANAFIHRISDLEAARFAADERSLRQQLAGAERNIRSTTQQIGQLQRDPAALSGLRVRLSAYESTYQTLFSSYVQFRAARDTALSDVSIYSPATVPNQPTGPHPLRDAVLVAFAILAISAALLYLYDYLDDSARDPAEAGEIVGAPVLGMVSRFPSGKQRGPLVAEQDARSSAADAYRLIRTNIQFTNVDDPPRTILITSPLPGEGKSTTVSNLAHVFAQSGSRVTLVDSDLHQPTLHQIFRIDRSREQGLTSMLLQPEALNGNALPRTEHANLTLIESGPLPPNPADLLGSRRADTVLAYLRERADLVFLDSPPLLPLTDATVLAAKADGVILVVDLKKSKRRDLRQARDAVEAVGGRILGVVVNRVATSGMRYSYYYQSYGKQSGDGL